MAALAEEGLSRQDKKALDLIAKGDKALTKPTYFGLMGSKASNSLSAAQLYKEAAKTYKLGSNYSEAALTYRKAAEAFEAGDEPLDGMDCWREASKMCSVGKLADIGEELMLKIIEKYEDNDKLDRIPKIYVQLAELMHDSGENEREAKYYQKAALSYEQNGNSNFAHKYRLLAADLLVRYTLSDDESVAKDCIKIYNAAISAYVDDSTRKFQVPGIALKTILCQVARGDMVAAKEDSEKIRGQAMNFEDSREDKFITAILEKIEDSNVEEFTDEVQEWNRIKGLDPLLTVLLTKAKAMIKKQQDAEEDDALA